MRGMKTRGTVIGLVIAATIATVAWLGTASATTRVYPATSSAPAAGICESAPGRVVTVRLYADMSEFRCYEVNKSQHLRFVNRSKRAMRVRAPFLHVTLQPGQEWTISGRVGSYLAAGDHRVGSSAWCCFALDIFLPGAAQPVPTGGAG